MAPARGRGGGRPHTPRPRAPRRRLRFGLQGKSSGKTLPKIEEGLVAKANPSSPESCSHQGKVPEAPDLEIKEEKIEGSSELQQESVINFSEIQDRLQDTEATSSSDVTLPTGVSTYVLQCLDSIIDHSTGVIDSPSSCLSPETFRDDDDQVSIVYAEDSGKYKNSTFLDPSNAVSIDRMPQALNLSAIPEPVREDFQVQYPVRKKASKPSYSSSQLSASTTLAGKKVHKIATARKKSPDLEAGVCCSSPLGVKRKPDNETAKPMGLKRKKKEKHLEEGQSSSLVPGAPGSSLAESEGLAAEIPSFKRRSAVEQMSPTGPVEEENKTLKSPGSARPSKLDLQCSRFPICSIIGTSPRQRSSVTKISVRSQAPRLPEGYPEDIITSAKIWANYKCQ